MTQTYYERKLAPLVGGKITAIAVDDSDEFGEIFYGLEVELPNGKKKVVFFLQDDEGNGPGGMDVLDVEEGK